MRTRIRSVVMRLGFSILTTAGVVAFIADPLGKRWSG
jgi:hypothetical protein